MSRHYRSCVLFAIAIAAGAVLISAGCNRFDASQVPIITVGSGVRPEIAWTPDPAYMLRMYEGSDDGDGIGVIWSVAGSSGYENRLRSPVVYGVPPAGSDYTGAPPLEAGKTYTVTIERVDEKGSGDGFTNTRRKYVGKHTFVASSGGAGP